MGRYPLTPEQRQRENYLARLRRNGRATPARVPKPKPADVVVPLLKWGVWFTDSKGLPDQRRPDVEAESEELALLVASVENHEQALYVMTPAPAWWSE